MPMGHRSLRAFDSFVAFCINDHIFEEFRRVIKILDMCSASLIDRYDVLKHQYNRGNRVS